MEKGFEYDNRAEEESTLQGKILYSVLALVILVVIFLLGFALGKADVKKSMQPENANGNVETEMISETTVIEDMKLQIENLEKQVEKLDGNLEILRERTETLENALAIQQLPQIQQTPQTQQLVPEEKEDGGSEKKDSGGVGSGEIS